MRFILLALIFGIASLAHAENSQQLNTDRPDRTAGPITVPENHFQLETDLLSYAVDPGAGGTKKTLLLNNMVGRFGVSKSVDVELSLATFQREFQSGGENASGVGDITLWAKWNLMGNDGNPIGLGLFPFLKLPTASGKLGNGKYEGGLLFPIALDLPHDFALDSMVGWQRSANDSAAGSHNELIFTLAVHHPIYKGLSGFTEIYLKTAGSAQKGPEETADIGLIYLTSENTQLDIGCNFGISEAAPAYNPFIGLSFRR